MVTEKTVPWGTELYIDAAYIGTIELAAFNTGWEMWLRGGCAKFLGAKPTREKAIALLVRRHEAGL